MDPRVLEVQDIRSVIEDKDTSRNALQSEALDFMSKPAAAATDNQVTTGSDSSEDFLEKRARSNETPEVKEAYRQLLEATKGLDPKVVEETLGLASDLAEKKVGLPGLGGGDRSKDQPKAAETEEGLVDPRVSGLYQTLLRKFTNPLVIRDIINVGKDLAQIAMSPQGRQLITDLRSLIKNFKEA